MTLRDLEPKALKSRLLADLVQAMAAGHPLQASTVAVLVGRTAPELVQQSLGPTTRPTPGADERLQLYLRHVVRLLSVAERHFGDVLLALHWYRNEQLALGLERTPEALAAAGRLEDAYRLLLRATQPPLGERR